MGLLLNAWSLQLVDAYRADVASAISDSTGRVMVLTEDLPSSPTIYTDENGTVLTQTFGIAVLPLVNGRVTFWTANTVQAVDITGITADGRAIGMNSVLPSQGRIYVNPMTGPQVVAIPFGASNNVERDTGLRLPSNCLISATDIKLRVTTIDAARTLQVGLLSSEAGGSVNGLINAASVATAGFVELLPQISNGAVIDFNTANFVGGFLGTNIAGADAVATVGGFTPKVYRTDGVARSISYTGSAGSATAAGYIYLSYTRLPF